MEKEYRKELFNYINGIVVIPTLKSFYELNIFNYMKTTDSFSINDIINNFKVNPGYINVSLRTLLSIKLLYKKDNLYFVHYDILNCILEHEEKIKLCSALNQYLAEFESNFSTNLESESKIINLFKSCNDIFDDFKNTNTNDIFEITLRKYIIGSITGPILSNIGFIDESINTFESKCPELNVFINSILGRIGLINSNLTLTDKGQFFNNRLSSFGVTTSYLPLLNNLTNVLTTNTNFIREHNSNGDERHVNRKMNVWGSGGAHKFYFKKIDNIILNIFNSKIEEQPKGIIDIGCGDGTFLEHCYNLITTQTIRKNYLKEYPIMLIGVDINKAARIATRNKLNKSNIDNIVINGNISDPDSINKTILNEYNANLEDFVNTRTFLDHNRVYSNPKEVKFNNIYSSGTFAFKGKIINNENLLNNLIEHFLNWKKYIHKHGLIILELHTINTDITANNQDSLLSCSYDATHGYSDQYLVEYDIFIKCASLANMQLSMESDLFPNKENPTISINYFI